MSNIRRFQPAKKATVCFKNNCVTVYDEAAEILNTIAITAGLFIALALVAKAIK
ncbi:hypothetical protein [Flavobacterium yafengii]|jgi:hypothetical protein|uniref:hypothetical protein n=1 Tax=Flavobacterium yafengii TaxID=3041253 RepID=UPI0024A8FA44|nr:hypothetical protein [Flavobacterium yafengii]MDI5897668.1 hypothetical protein [Flavobacterium yafengii]MDO8316073.1 hypothetical protein [Flavobacterium sp.]